MGTMPTSGAIGTSYRVGSGDGGGSSNQFFGSMPSMPNMWNTPYKTMFDSGSNGWAGTPPTMPGVVPQQGQGAPSNPGTSNYYGPGINSIGHGFYSQQPLDPTLTGYLAQYLQSQVGAGVSPFNLSAQLPTGGTTMPGQLSAPMNPLLQQLFSGYQGGATNVPGFGTLSNIANNGIDALPEWQSMIAAQQQNIQQNQANLREQFGSMGALAGDPFGTAMSNYLQQTSKDQNALLGQLQQQNILQGQLPAAQSLMTGAQNMGGLAQGLDENSIQQLYNEFIRTSPQYNPMNQEIYGLSTTFNPILSKSYGTGATGGLLGNVGSLAGAAGAGLGASAGGAGVFGSILAGLAGL